MRHASQSRRSRSRGNGGRKGGPNRSQVFDSNGPDVRIRGTAHQVCEKYIALAKDATGAGDFVLAQSYLQHAEHYQRIINSWDSENRSGQKEIQKKGQPHGNGVQPDGNRADGKSGNGFAGNTGNEDLSLPSSVLGAPVQASSESQSQKETTLEDA